MGQLSWERVLHAVEADARRAEALLAADEWQHEHIAASEELPPLAEMPPLPDELVADVQALQTRIMTLQDELKTAMGQWRPAPEPPARPLSARPRLVDREL